MNNPLHILLTLSRHLRSTAKLTVFGRGALALAFPRAPSRYAASLDVDGIVPIAEPLTSDFWEAQQKTNAQLRNAGLYITHLFSETDLILSEAWLLHRVELDLQLPNLAVFRPAVIDLILTKMARADSQDLEDIEFLLRQERLEPQALQGAFKTARVPSVEEIRDLFAAAQPKVLALAENLVS